MGLRRRTGRAADRRRGSRRRPVPALVRAQKTPGGWGTTGRHNLRLGEPVPPRESGRKSGKGSNRSRASSTVPGKSSASETAGSAGRSPLSERCRAGAWARLEPAAQAGSHPAWCSQWAPRVQRCGTNGRVLPCTLRRGVLAVPCSRQAEIKPARPDLGNASGGSNVTKHPVRAVLRGAVVGAAAVSRTPGVGTATFPDSGAAACGGAAT